MVSYLIRYLSVCHKVYATLTLKKTFQSEQYFTSLVMNIHKSSFYHFHYYLKNVYYYLLLYYINISVYLLTTSIILFFSEAYSCGFFRVVFQNYPNLT